MDLKFRREILGLISEGFSGGLGSLSFALGCVGAIQAKTTGFDLSSGLM